VLVLSLCLVRWQTTIAPAQISHNSNSWVGCASELMAITGIYLLPATNYKSLPHGHYVGELSRNLALAKNTPANRPACMVKCSRPLVIYRVQKVFSLFVDITYQTECSKNSACLYEHWRELFQRSKEGSCLRSPQGCIRSDIGIKKVENRWIQRGQSAMF
jgi:hypothetical protein